MSGLTEEQKKELEDKRARDEKREFIMPITVPCKVATFEIDPKDVSKKEMKVEIKEFTIKTVKDFNDLTLNEMNPLKAAEEGKPVPIAPISNIMFSMLIDKVLLKPDEPVEAFGLAEDWADDQ